MQHETSNSFMSQFFFWLGAVLAIAATGLTGCNRGPDMYRVSGHVLYKDGSVPKGSVSIVGFLPSKNSTAVIRKGATGVIGPDGAFELITRKPGDGVHQGEYDVRFVVRRSVMDPSTSLIPAKYENVATSGYNNIKVDHDISDLEFEIEPLPGAPRG